MHNGDYNPGLPGLDPTVRERRVKQGKEPKAVTGS